MKWVIRGSIAQDSIFVHEGVDLSKHLNNIISQLPDKLEPPEYCGRKIGVYKTDTDKPIYFGFGEVSNGCFCYWVLE